MLVKTLFVFAAAIVAAIATEQPDDAAQKPLKPRPCAECKPCSVDCICPKTHRAICPPKPPPRDPQGRTVCPENFPCEPDCVCSSALMGKSPPKTPSGRAVCAEGQPCTDDCICYWANLLSYTNPNALRAETTLCDKAACNATCICRETLLKSVEALLFPPNGTKQIKFAESEANKDEL